MKTMTDPAGFVVTSPTSYHIVAPLVALADLDELDRFDPAGDTDDGHLALAAAATTLSRRPDFGWLAGRYICADTVNRNGHIFRLSDVQRRHDTVVHTPLNMLHRQHHVVGTWVQSDLLYPTHAAAGDGDLPMPYTFTTAAFWRYPFNDEWLAVRKAHEQGLAFISMECQPETLTCAECGGNYPYRGPIDSSYCPDMRTNLVAPKYLENPLFIGGGAIIPPARPGWKDADITKLAAMCLAATETDDMWNAIVAAAPTLSDGEWLAIMRMAQQIAVGTAGGYDTPPSKRRRRMAAQPADDQLISKADANYRPASDPSKSCGTCGHYDGNGGCAVVSGTISPSMVSDKWTAGKPAAAWLDIASAAANSHTAIIAAVPDDDGRAAIAALGTEPADDIHVTLAVLGEIGPDGNVGPYSIELCMGALAAFAAGAPTLHATVSGVGRFDLGDGYAATYASVDSPGLNELQTRLVAALGAAGIHVGRDHGFTPHATIGYGPIDAPTPQPPQPPVEFDVDGLELWWGDTRLGYPLGAGAVPFYASAAELAEIEGEYAKDYTAAERRQGAKEGWCMPDGSYPTKTRQDLDNAMQSFGRAPASKRASLKRYLLRRARALGAGPDVMARIREYSTT